MKGRKPLEADEVGTAYNVLQWGRPDEGTETAAQVAKNLNIIRLQWGRPDERTETFGSDSTQDRHRLLQWGRPDEGTETQVDGLEHRKP